MPVIQSIDLVNAKTDVDHIAAIATSTAPTATDRLGNTKDTVAGAMIKIASFNDRGAWVTATAYAVKDLVSNSGTWYVCVVAHTSSASFSTDTATKWRIYQGVTEGDLSASSGSSLVNFINGGTGAASRTVQSKLRDVVSAKDFAGVVGDGVNDDTAGLNAFLLVATRGYIPAGTYKITGTLTFASNQVISGDGPATIINYQASSPAANSAVLDLSSQSNTRVSGLTMQVDTTTFASERSIYMNGSTNCHVSDILFSGGAGANAAYLNSATRCSVSRCYVDDYRGDGFYVNGGYGNVIEDCDIPDGSGGLMGIHLVGGESNVARGNRIAKSPDNYFGIHAYAGNFPLVTGNHVKNTRREAIALGGGQMGARVTNNTLYWDANLGTGDFGLSVAGDDSSDIVAEFLIDGNTIVNSALDGIGIAGWCQRGRVTNNIIRDCARAASSGHQAGIKLYGWVTGAVVNDVVIEGNIVSKINGSMLYAVTEDAGLGSSSSNIIRGNKTYGLSGETYPITTASMLVLNDEDLSVVNYVPTLSAASGTITTATASLGYQRVGKFILCRLNVTVTTNGSGAVGIIVSLPFTASGGVLTGVESVLTGKSCKAGISGSGNQLTVTSYDNTYPGGSGASMNLMGILSVA